LLDSSILIAGGWSSMGQDLTDYADYQHFWNSCLYLMPFMF